MPITLGGYDPEGKVRLSAYFDGLADVWTVRRNLRSVIYDQRLERAAPAFESAPRHGGSCSPAQLWQWWKCL